MTRLEQIIALGNARMDLRVERVIAVHMQEFATDRPAEPSLRNNWVPLKNFPFDYHNVDEEAIARVSLDVSIMRGIPKNADKASD